jgi:polysaccharide export outer membrane protein
MNMKICDMLGLAVTALLLSHSTLSLCFGQADKTPPKDLIQYVRDAARLGLKSEQIQQNAVKAGWPAALVNEAIAATAQTGTPDGAAQSGSQEPQSNTAPQTANVPATLEAAPAATASSMLDGDSRDEYRIGAGDVLQISVWKEPEASVGAAVVRPDGKVSLPIIKDLEVVGMTPSQAEKVITERLSKMIPAADVTVVVAAINSKKVYLVGAVRKEGPIPYTYRMTVMQALSEAGGLSDYAKRKKIYILRTQNGKDYRLPFDYEAVLRGERMELNIPLLAGDTIVVPN